MPYSERLSLTLTHPSVVLAQQYLALSPKCEDILSGWKKAQEVSDSIITSIVMLSHSLFHLCFIYCRTLKVKNTSLVEASMHLLTTLVKLLSPIPYFLPSLQNLADKFLDTSESYGDYVSFFETCKPLSYKPQAHKVVALSSVK